MTEPMHQQLLGHLLGALDDDEHARVDAQLEHDDEYCRELARWRQRLGPIETLRPEFDPQPGLADRTCRYVAAHVPPVGSWSWRGPRPMTSLPVPPSCINYVGWLDLAVVALLLLTFASLLFPAIDSSRFQTSLAVCQDSLRQFGLALSQYGGRQQTALDQLADDGRLTDAGLFAAGLLPAGYLSDSRRPGCPDAWLAAQGALRGRASSGTGIGVRFAPQPYDNWPGTWRDGTNHRRRLPPSPAELPLLADAPSADLPGQAFLSHGGRGRNILFDDGHIGFLPNSSPSTPPDSLLSRDEDLAISGISVPIVFVSGH